MENEIWKDVVGYEGLYQVSNIGGIRSLDRVVYRSGVKVPLKGVKLKQQLDTNGYAIIRLHKEGKGKTMKIHQMVANAFLNHVPNSNNLVIDHIDFNKSNNNLSNLQLISTFENNFRSGLYSKTSNEIGVYYVESKNRWLAVFRTGDKNMKLSFNNEDTAIFFSRKFKKHNMTNRITPELITDINDNEVFVFGSNQSGRHGKGAARTALKWGAKYSQAEGLQGKTYGIPTKDKSIKRTLSINEIKPYVHRFLYFAKNNPQLNFYVTEIGCGLAGLKPKEIAPLFIEAITIENIYLPKRFWHSIGK